MLHLLLLLLHLDDFLDSCFCTKMLLVVDTNNCLVGLSERVDNVYGDRNLVCTLLPAAQVVEEEKAATA